MTTSRPHVRATALAAALLGLAIPSVAVANASGTPTPTPPTTTTSGGSGNPTGGGGLAPTSPTAPASPTSPTTRPAPTVTPVGGPVQASGNGFTLATTAAGTYRRALDFTGTVPAADHSAELEIERRSGTGAWQQVAQTPVADNGSFSLVWHPNVSGMTSFRATLAPPPNTAAAASADPAPASPALAVTIYRDSIATIYGPGFFGHKTACGQRLTPATVGVASRTLKCGTQVSIDFDGRSVTVPVIDRGPFANHATWDLTSATAAALGDEGTETVGAAVL